jgi:hypothetical protein
VKICEFQLQAVWRRQVVVTPHDQSASVNSRRTMRFMHAEESSRAIVDRVMRNRLDRQDKFLGGGVCLVEKTDVDIDSDVVSQD